MPTTLKPTPDLVKQAESLASDLAKTGGADNADLVDAQNKAHSWESNATGKLKLYHPKFNHRGLLPQSFSRDLYHGHDVSL